MEDESPVTLGVEVEKRVESRYCPDHGLELEIAYEKNRYSVAVGGGDFGHITLGEDFDTKTGEPLYCIVGRCPVKESGWFADTTKSHYIKLIKSDATRSTPSPTSPQKEVGDTFSCCICDNHPFCGSGKFCEKHWKGEQT